MKDVSLKNDGDGMTNVEILQFAKKLKLRNFEYFMRDNLINKSPDSLEMGIVNLDSRRGEGTHHIAYFKNGDEKFYSDSFRVRPPKEVIKYLKSPVLYSTYMIQEYNDSNCSEWSLFDLNRLNNGQDFIDLILEIINSHNIN